MKIYAPVKDANGVWASVRFVNGIGETDNPKLIEWFRTHGYAVEDSPRVEGASTVHPLSDVEDVGNVTQLDETSNLVIESQNDQVEDKNDEVEMMGYAEKEKSFEDMTPNELRQWMMENGFGLKIRNTRNKEKLLEILRG